MSTPRPTTTVVRSSGGRGQGVEPPPPGDRRPALARLLRGIDDDLREYSSLHDLLELQFQAMLRHESPRLEALSGQIAGLVDVLAARRDERSALLREVLGAGHGAFHWEMGAALALLPAALQPTHDAAWRALEALVRDCKRINSRNCHLLMEQFSLMQRVMHGEDRLYEPA